MVENFVYSEKSIIFVDTKNFSKKIGKMKILEQGDKLVFKKGGKEIHYEVVNGLLDGDYYLMIKDNAWQNWEVFSFVGIDATDSRGGQKYCATIVGEENVRPGGFPEMSSLDLTKVTLAIGLECDGITLNGEDVKSSCSKKAKDISSSPVNRVRISLI